MERLRKAPSPARRKGGLSLGFGLALAFLAIAVLSGRAFAQETGPRDRFDLTGVVTGEAGQPLVGAFVQLEGSKWGSLTDDKGRFRIPDMDPGPTSLVVQQLGYDTLRWEGPVQAGQPLALEMKARPLLLEGLHVVTDRFASRRKATAMSVRSFGRDDLATTPQQTALDFVVARAGVWRTLCGWSEPCFVVRGRAVNPRVWVDEVPVFDGMNYLQSISPYELYMVEVYANGRQIRLYTPRFMERAAKTRLQPIPFVM